jgi:hypothetical protein
MKHLTAGVLLAGSAVAFGGSLLWTSQAQLNASSGRLTAEPFTLEVPGSLTKTTELWDDGETTTEYVNADGSERLLIFSLPFAESLTTAHIEGQYPSSVIESFGLSLVDGAPAFTFFTDNGNEYGGSFEVWFVHDGRLYEVITHAPLDTWLTDILNTWRFR